MTLVRLALMTLLHRGQDRLNETAQSDCRIKELHYVSEKFGYINSNVR